MKRYKYKLLPLCEEIHMAITGASDGFSKEQGKEIYRWLKWRIYGEQWYESKEFTAEYDRIVHKLCRYSLIELGNWLLD